MPTFDVTRSLIQATAWTVLATTKNLLRGQVVTHIPLPVDAINVKVGFEAPDGPVYKPQQEYRGNMKVSYTGPAMVGTMDKVPLTTGNVALCVISSADRCSAT